MQVTRRDFLNGVAISVTAGLVPSALLHAEPKLAQRTLYYPPALSGMRGNHDGSFGNAHALGRGGKKFAVSAVPLAEEYDLVVVGAGISGLAAALFYQQRHGQQQRILILDNHDDFGGHAKRNELHSDEQTVLAYGGSESLQSPRSIWSERALSLIQDLGVDLDRLEAAFAVDFYPDLGLSRGVYFDRANFGVDKVVAGSPTRKVADDIPPERMNARSYTDFINDFPLSEADRQALIELHLNPHDYLAGLSVADKISWCDRNSYTTFLQDKVGLAESAIRYFQQQTNDFQAVGIDATSVSDARLCGLPGTSALGLPAMDAEQQAELDDPYIFHFPDGNASLARLLVRRLIPKVAPPGKSMEDVLLAVFDYSQLDVANTPVRLRLNSTAVQAANVQVDGEGRVDLAYVCDEQITRVRARHVVMAGYNMMIPYIVPEMPQAQKDALAQNVKLPLVYTKVVLRNWRAFKQLGVHDIYCPTAPFCEIKLDFPVSLGGYEHPRDPDKPIGLHMIMVPVMPGSGLSTREQARKGRAFLLGTPFAEFERLVREQLQGMLGSAGFDHQHDIAEITVNRWAHGYSYFFNGLFDDEEGADKIIQTARQPIGNISIANSDSDWNPYAHAAIDQAWRAVSELSGAGV
jgi:spermidine dehydrogenase